MIQMDMNVLGEEEGPWTCGLQEPESPCEGPGSGHDMIGMIAVTREEATKKEKRDVSFKVKKS